MAKILGIRIGKSKEGQGVAAVVKTPGEQRWDEMMKERGFSGRAADVRTPAFMRKSVQEASQTPVEEGPVEDLDIPAFVRRGRRSAG